MKIFYICDVLVLYKKLFEINYSKEIQFSQCPPDIGGFSEFSLIIVFTETETVPLRFSDISVVLYHLTEFASYRVLIKYSRDVSPRVICIVDVNL